jgi:hypothetical protein
VEENGARRFLARSKTFLEKEKKEKRKELVGVVTRGGYARATLSVKPKMKLIFHTKSLRLPRRVTISLLSNTTNPRIIFNSKNVFSK